jgi:hypothetical protein
MQIWIYVTKSALTVRQRAVFRGRREKWELLEFLAKHGSAWMEEAARRALRGDSKGVNRLRLGEWLMRCRLEAAGATPAVSPVRKTTKRKSVADLPATTRYDDDT